MRAHTGPTKASSYWSGNVIIILVISYECLLASLSTYKYEALWWRGMFIGLPWLCLAIGSWL